MKSDDVIRLASVHKGLSPSTSMSIQLYDSHAMRLRGAKER